MRKKQVPKKNTKLPIIINQSELKKLVVTLKANNIIWGTEDNELSNNLSLYPSPSTGRFTLDLGNEYTGDKVQISNSPGQIISLKKIHFGKSY